MEATLHPTIAAYVEASNTRDADGIVRCFASDGVVADEGRTYRGHEEIRRWFLHTLEAYGFSFEHVATAGEGADILVTLQVSGTFPGSPVELPFRFTLANDRIGALRIGE